MPLDRNADPAAMAARIKELEAAQAAAPPVSPLVRLWTIGGEVLGLFPKWLLVAALAVFIAYHGYSYYMQARQMAAETARIDIESRVHTDIPPAPPMARTNTAPVAGTGTANTPTATPSPLPSPPLHAGQRPVL